MLFVLTGLSAAGKSAVLPEVSARVENLELHDFGRRAACLGHRPGKQPRAPIGEWLAAPSAAELDGIAVCLMDVSDEIRQAGWESMRWQRWQHWQRGDPRWDVSALDTSVAPIDETVEQLVRWIGERRASHRGGTLALSGRWWT